MSQPPTLPALPTLADGASTRPWRRDTAFFLGGQTVSLLGSALVQYSVLWHLTLTTKSGGILTLSALFGFLPQALISVFAGVWADRYSRKLLIIGADAVIALVTLGLALSFLRGYQELWLIFAVLVIRSLGAGIQTPAVGAFLPQIVPVDRLMRVNGFNGSIQSGITVLAPALAAWMYANFDLEAIFFVDVVTAAAGISLVSVVRVPKLVRGHAPDGGYFGELRAGLRYVRSHRVITRVLVFYALTFFLVVPPSYLTPLLIARTFGTEVWRLTANELAFSIGMLIGGAIIAAWGGLRNRMVMMATTAIAFGVLAVAMGLSPWFWVFIGLMGLAGLAVAGFSTPAITLLQETSEPAVQGRVFSLLGIVMALTMPVGMVVFGPLADTISVETILVVSGVLMLAVGLVAFSSSARIGREAAAERARTHTPEPAVTE